MAAVNIELMPMAALRFDPLLTISAQIQADAQARLPGANKDSGEKSEGQSRYKELVEQIKDIRSKQGEHRNARQANQDKIKALDNQLKAKMTEQKADRQKIPFNSVSAIDEEIKRLEATVESGTLRMVDERKTLDTISSLRKQRKGFGSIDQRNKDIDDIKAQITALKQPNDSPEQKQLSADYERLDKELKSIKEADQAKRGDINANRDALRAARDAREAAYQDRKKLQDEFYSEKRAYRKYEQEAAKVREAKRKTEREAYQRGRKEEALKRKLEEASLPAYGDEIRAAESIIYLLDPSSATQATVSAPGQFAAQAQRTVDEAGIKGTKLVKNDEESYFVGTGGKKGKKGRKAPAAAVSTEPGSPASPAPAGRDLVNKLWAPGSMEMLSLLKLDPPSEATGVPALLEATKEKRKFFYDDRDRKTKEVSSGALISAYESLANTHCHRILTRPRRSSRPSRPRMPPPVPTVPRRRMARPKPPRSSRRRSSTAAPRCAAAASWSTCIWRLVMTKGWTEKLGQKGLRQLRSEYTDLQILL